MSENIVGILAGQLDLSESYLEWGSGNSTILALEEYNLRTIVSIEHSKQFYLMLLKEVLNKLDTNAKIKITFYSVKNKTKQPADDSLIYNHLASSKSLGIRTHTASTLNIIKRLFSYKIRNRASIYNYDAGQSVELPGFEAIEAVERSNHKLLLCKMHINETQFSYVYAAPDNDRYVSDGDAVAFHNYIEAPLITTDQLRYDTILVDGRSRTGCLNFVSNNNFAGENGKIFVHDAWRSYLIDGLKNFREVTFYHGNNQRVDGKVFSDGINAPLGKLGVFNELAICRN